MWTVDETKILSASEIKMVLEDLKKRSLRSVNSGINKTVFRLATCCGLRASEIANLEIQDLVVGVPKPYIHIRKSISKNKKPRRVPLWWDQGTLTDLETWYKFRILYKAGPHDPFICSCCTKKASYGKKMDRKRLRRRFIVACRSLGRARQDCLTIHHGRHSYVSHALRAGRTLAEVRAAVGHSSINVTSLYTHIAVEDGGEVKNIF